MTPARPNQRPPRAVPRRSPRMRETPPPTPPAPDPFVPSQHSRREWAWAVAAVVLAWMLLFFPHLVLGQRVVLGDASYYRPFADFSRTRWHETHQRTYWNPYVFMGLESVASYSDPRPQYLPDALLSLADRLGNPPFSPQLWPLLAHLAGTLSLLALARRLWGADPWSAAVAALAWMLTLPILGPLDHGFDAQLLADAVIPVVLLGTQLVITAATARTWSLAGLGLALALGVQCLHGHPQILVYSATLTALFALQQARQHRRAMRLLPWAGAVVLGAALGAAMWWPALIYGAASSRTGAGGAGVAMAVVAKYSFHWRDLLSIVWPQAVGFGHATYWGGMQIADYSPYLGVVACVLALGGMRSVRGDAGARFWWGVFVVCVVLSLGATLGPAFELLRAVIPFWNRFRAVNYVTIGACVALALLAARGASRVTPAPERVARGSVPWFAILGALGVLGVAIALGPLRGVYVAMARAARPEFTDAVAGRAATWAGLDLVAIAGLVWLTLLLRARVRAGHAWARIALVALVALDLGVVAAPGLWRSTGPASKVAPPPPPLLARVAAAAPHARVYVGAAVPVPAPAYAIGNFAEAYTNFWVSWRARCLTGNIGAFPGAWQWAISNNMTRSAGVLRAWGVEYYDLDRAAPSPPGATPIREDERCRVYRLPGALGRVYAVSLVVALPDVETLVSAMKHPNFNPAWVAVTTDEAAAGEYPGSRTAAIRWVRDDPERIELDVTAVDRAFIVIADTYAAGWTATVDDAPEPVRSVDLLVRGVAVPAGHHRVTLAYETPGMRRGVAATRAAGGLWLLLLVLAGTRAFVGASRSRRRDPAPEKPATV